MKKLTKIATLILAGTMALSLAACGSSSTSSPEETVNPVDKINIVNKDGEIVSGPALETPEVTEEPVAETEAVSIERTLYPGTQNINLDEGSVTINGVTYTIGVTTMQDMIDGGFPFDEDYLIAANNQMGNGRLSSILVDRSFYDASYLGFDASDADTVEESVLSSIDISIADFSANPTSEDYMRWSFTIDGTTYEPAVMSIQDVMDEVGSYNEYSEDYEKSADNTAPVDGYIDGVNITNATTVGAYEVTSYIKFYAYNDTGAETAKRNCMAVPGKIAVEVDW